MNPPQLRRALLLIIRLSVGLLPAAALADTECSHHPRRRSQLAQMAETKRA